MKTIILSKADVTYPYSTEHEHKEDMVLDSVLGGLFRRALPFLKSGAEILGKQALNVTTDMIDGKSFKELAKDRLKEGITTFASQREAIQQSGSGVRKKRRHQSKKSNKKSKKRKVDIFD